MITLMVACAGLYSSWRFWFCEEARSSRPLATVLRIMATGSLGAFGGSFAYLIHSLAGMNRAWSFLSTLGTGLPFWLLMMSLTVWPIAFASAAAGLFVRKTFPFRFAWLMLPAIGALALVSTTVFLWYMPLMSPAINWQRSWSLPLTASALSFLVATYFTEKWGRGPSLPPAMQGA
ncbi:hypothetical protein GRI97_14695 [Altererythrobacter xixiisoli]|uniref:Uncharacterized protein n=1 Tax=Croceibacterium xixiisoli TaxID=1476466 RepID=A0A6I4TYQ4_9SPHN|nr:hypothetical protein [Croceibacterium xixiisoli]MXP00240.1 hypothetical protein [Croceibacterium xixiisoli]